MYFKLLVRFSILLQIFFVLPFLSCAFLFFLSKFHLICFSAVASCSTTPLFRFHYLIYRYLFFLLCSKRFLHLFCTQSCLLCRYIIFLNLAITVCFSIWHFSFEFRHGSSPYEERCACVLPSNVWMIFFQRNSTLLLHASFPLLIRFFSNMWWSKFALGLSNTTNANIKIQVSYSQVHFISWKAGL